MEYTYYIVDAKDSGDEFTIGKTEDLEEALKTARDSWDKMTPHDQRHSDIQVRHYLYDIEDENCTCFDFDTEPWYEWFAVQTDEGDVQGKGSFDFSEADAMASEYPDGHLAVIDIRTGFCEEVLSREWLDDNKRVWEV
jgi:hypothetical protein